MLPKDIGLNRPIWIHAVSVGEAMAVKGLLEELRLNYPEKKFVISTVTVTGNKIASGLAKEGDFVTYLPLDFSFIVKSVVNRINPAVFIITETEIWPNLIATLYKRDIPIILVNGRISDKSFRGYSCVKFLLKPVLKKISLFCVQTDCDAQRFMRLGVRKDKIRVTGNMKFDAAFGALHKPELLQLVKEKVFVAGSTHDKEEEMVLDVYGKLRADFPGLRLLIAPRHPERVSDVEKIIIKYGFSPIRISSLNKPISNKDSENTVLILDAVGQLLSYYAAADIVFVGGSLIKKGGHNILEPASVGKPILFGPYMFNFRDIADLFLKQKAGILVRNMEELYSGIKNLLDNPDKMSNLGETARVLVLKNRGATKKNLELIKRLQIKGELG